MTELSSNGFFQERASRLMRGASVAVLASTLLAANAYAQDADQDSGLGTPAGEDEIVATGIRQSLDQAQDIKRNADTFVDSITATDIGNLPDPSVLEALQRVPGVSISRFAAGDDPDHFSVEGSGLVIRGLNFVRSEFNGRDAFTANNGRALSFNDVPPELVGGVDVFKNQTADMVEGGISGVVNLRTIKPFETKEDFVIAGQAEYTYTDLAEEWSPAGSLLVSKRWDTGGGEFGLLGNISYSNLQSRSDGFQLSPLYPYNAGFNGAGVDGSDTNIAAPGGANIRTQFFDRDRFGLALSGQWASNDDRFLATAEFIRSDASNAWNEFSSVSEEDPATRAGNFAVGEFGTSPFVTTVPATRDDTSPIPVSALFTNGTISSGTAGWYSTPLPGVRQANGTRFSDTDTVTSDYSFNLKFRPNDRIRTNFDVQYVDATTENMDISIFVAQPLDILLSTGITGGQSLTGLDPTVEYRVNPGAPGGADNNATTPQGAYWRAAMDHFEDSEGDELAIRGDIEIDAAEDGFVKSMRFGARYADRDQTTRWSVYNWGNLSEEWAGGVDDFSEITQNTTTFTYDNFLRGDVLQGNNTFLFADPSLVENYDQLISFVNSAGFTNYGGHLRGEREDGLFLPGEIAQVSEETLAFYGRLDFGLDEFIGGTTLEGNIGARIVQTTIDSVGFRNFNAPQCNQAGLTIVNDGGFCNFVTSPDAGAEFVASNTFTNALPSLNVKVGLSENLILRFAAAKSISRPDTGLYRASQFVFGDFNTISPVGDPNQVSEFVRATVQGGNPGLRPVEAFKVDGSLEWYFDDVGSLTFSVFNQELDGIITSDFTSIDIGGGFVGEFQGPNNQADGSVRGFEIAYQQTYDFLPGLLGNFGSQINYTYVDQESIPLATVNGVRPTAAIEFTNAIAVDRLEQLSDHTVNLVGFYEDDNIEARVAYNWRSEFLLTGSDVITRLPVFNEDTGQLDASFKYNVTDNFQLGVQGVNLLSEVTETSVQFNPQGTRITRSLFENDRRITFLGSFKF